MPNRVAHWKRQIRLRPANSFDLIRLIAHSQGDSRKAVAELVQNSLDAAADMVTISRQRRRGVVAISITDNGRGVFPELERPAALERIATHIGHSFKRNFSALERQKQMMLGKYGIGILGFWCIGQELEIRSRVAGSDVWALRLVRDEPLGEVRRVPHPRTMLADETWTEVVVQGVHPGPARQLSARRLGEYLGSELRGQLLGRKVKLRMVDRLARGSVAKEFFVVPQRFQGRRLPIAEQWPVPGYGHAQLELYFAEQAEPQQARVALSCGGAVVCQDLGALEDCGLDPSIWSAGGLEGVIDFACLEVAPATRRGFIPGPEADALLEALCRLQEQLRVVLDQEQQRREAEAEEDLARELRRVFRPLPKTLPQYDFFEVRSRAASGERGVARLGRSEAVAETAGEIPQEAVVAKEQQESLVVEAGEPVEPPVDIFPPGPLDRVVIVPRKVRLLPGATRAFVARPLDEQGRLVTSPVLFTWSISEGDGQLLSRDGRAQVTVPQVIGSLRLAVTAEDGTGKCVGEAEIEVVDKLGGGNAEAGIPNPERAYDPQGDWRSRVVGNRWQYNAAHPDYQAVVDVPRLRLRYLVHLLAKEMVLRNYGQVQDERLLERMVEVLTHISPRI